MQLLLYYFMLESSEKVDSVMKLIGSENASGVNYAEFILFMFIVFGSLLFYKKVIEKQ